jgi:hypothetical protein
MGGIFDDESRQQHRQANILNAFFGTCPSEPCDLIEDRSLYASMA